MHHIYRKPSLVLSVFFLHWAGSLFIGLSEQQLPVSGAEVDYSEPEE